MLRRTIAISVAEVISGGTKQEFYEDVRKSLDLSRQAANRTVSVCMQQDETLWSGGKAPKLYAYPVIASEFPGVASVAANITNTVTQQYRRDRWEIQKGRRSAPTFRSFPWPLLNNKSDSMVHVTDAGEYLACRIKLLSGWWVVRLAGGSSHRDQIAGLRNALSFANTAVGSKPARGTDAINQVVTGGISDSKLWQDRRGVAVLGISVRLPDPIGRAVEGDLVVKSAVDALLIASRERDTVPFTINADHVRQWQSHREYQKTRLMQDRKSGASRSSIKVKMTEISMKHIRRMDSFTHEVSSQIVQHAVRRKVQRVVLDLTVKSYMPSFPWFQLSSKIKYKCEDNGIEFVDASLKIAQPDIDSPHVYFAFSPTCSRVKIGKTARSGMDRIREMNTGSPEDLILLAVDNQSKATLVKKEKHHHAYFSASRDKRANATEWFIAEPVIRWLREVGWLGNAGNLSQILQHLEV